MAAKWLKSKVAAKCEGLTFDFDAAPSFPHSLPGGKTWWCCL